MIKRNKKIKLEKLKKKKQLNSNFTFICEKWLLRERVFIREHK